MRSHLTGVEDKQPWWATLLNRLAVAAIVVAIVVVLIYLWPILRPILNRAGYLIPDRSRREAAMGMKLLAGQLSKEEFVAASRARDPGTDAAWRQMRAVQVIDPIDHPAGGLSLPSSSSSFSSSTSSSGQTSGTGGSAHDEGETWRT